MRKSNGMVCDLKKQDRMKRSLYLAQEVQQSLLPHKYPRLDNLDIAGKSIHTVKDLEHSGQFITMFYLSIDMAQKSLQWVRADHDPGIFYDPPSDTWKAGI
jgi:serine phosphatase RsbU (regulator of sigma subunit)